MTPLEKCIRTAKLAGVPSDQVSRFINAKYIPLPWQWQFHADARHADETNGPVDIGLGGARGPGKSHAVLSQAAIDDCKRVANLKGLFLRQTGLAAKESFDDLVSKVLFGHVPYTKTGSVLKVGDNGRIVLGGFKDQNDIDKYIGIEYDFIIVEELNQLTKDKYEKLRGSLRTSKPNWRPRMYTSFNPGGIGHEFVRSRYVIPQRENRERDTRFIGSNYRSNPHLNKEYIEYLEALTGDLGMAWREGDWDRFAGQVFSEFSYDRHTIKPFIPRVGDTYMSIDWGYSEKSAFAAYLHKVVQMKTEDGQNFTRVITFKEWYGSQVNPEDWAERIYNDCIVMGVKPNKAIVDGAMLDKLQDGSVGIGKTMMKKWKELNKDVEWCPMVAANKNRIGRVAVVHNWLSSPKYVDKLGREKSDLPYWLITQNCPNLIRTLPLLTYDEHRVDDVDCFIAGTMIKTIHGNKPIELIKNGDMILTPIGYREAYICGEPKKSTITTIKLSNGKELTGTSYHKVYIRDKGLVELQNLKMFDILEEWNTTNLSKKLFTKVLNIDATLTDAIINLKQNTLNKDIQHFTVRYGLIIMARFLIITMSIILTTIRTITILKILPSLIKKNTLNFTTTKELTSRENLRNGETQKKEKALLKRTLIKCLTEILSGNYRAFIVENILGQNTRQKGTAAKSAKHSITARIIQYFVKYAGSHLYSREKRTHRPVHIVAVGNSGEEIVYRLRVKQAHLYYANGILCTNTSLEDHAYDSVGYFLYKVKFTAVKAGTHSYHIKSPTVQLQYNASNQQLAFDPKEFANRF